MKTRFKKIITILSALVISAGAFLLCCGFTSRLPKGVKINGIDVGRLSVGEAKERLRGAVEENLKDRRLRISADGRAYEFAYPEIDYAENFADVLADAKRAGDYGAEITYFLNGAEEIVDSIAAFTDREVVEPYVVFQSASGAGEPFVYFDGEDGRICDRERLISDINASLAVGEWNAVGDFEAVTAKVRTVKRQNSTAHMRELTKKLYSFTTYFDGSNSDRASNIKRAASKIDGTVLGAGEIFSFNGIVGARTEENGFRPSKIIENGKFVTGVGGGVCQVSTTLYNAALLSGLKICEYHPHSLQVGYVPPSRDAMVSGSYFDLKFENANDTPVYISAVCGSNSITCTVYGRSDGVKYSLRSAAIGVIPRPDPVEEEGDEDGVAYGRDGLESEGYLIKCEDGVTEETLIRRDKYAGIADVVKRKRVEIIDEPLA